MTVLKAIFYFFLFFLSFRVNAFNLTDQLTHFFEKNHLFDNKKIHVILHTQLKKNIFCKRPFFSLLQNFHYFGLIEVLYTCGKDRQYLQVEVQVEGEYVTANKKILRGSRIKESDLKIIIGRLDTLPNHTYFQMKDVINKVSLRDIFPFQPVTSFMVRPLWLVKINQMVNIVVHGVNFIIFTKGKALENAANNENVRVKINNNNVINGKVNENGEVIVFM
ncbi:flagellar basal body P-ring formation protein FlgA [Buchnera aphidicola (Muscaphis stroyani)]|uniref:Flagella basal body P-ring formation protein FlgA n=1 Tax=Buchnera aphidicola (Muscaphis stroyani) TaxID=1241869 RepID=A0A4D6Y4Q2_9GAMM|nr:flagellar basal body P-ring formation chaperone FlgA [Buchnera aphidicola]QCI24402.1 flagellar basal body P-ring formation protein FlgA [Buchnera aphidicola (Muscaphis stroyani)]